MRPCRLVPVACALACALAFGGLAAGCDDAFVDPFLRDEGPFSLYGFLLSDQVPLEHVVRVVPVRTLPEAPTDPDAPTAQLDVDVWSTHLGTGDSLAWTERVVRYDDGTVGYLFARTFRAEPNTTYRLSVRRRADGHTATADVAVPPVPAATLGEARVVAPDSVVQTVGWDDAARLDSVTVAYKVPVDGRTAFVRLEYPPVPVGEGPRTVAVDYVRDAARLRVLLGLEEGTPVVLYEMLMRVRAPSGAWVLPTDDLAVIAQPGVFENVEGGHGFVGGATYGAVYWVPPPDVVQAAGFVPAQP